MKKYILFKFSTADYSASLSGGWNHFVGDYDLLKDALHAGKPCIGYEVAQVVNRDTKEIIFEGDPAKDWE